MMFWYTCHRLLDMRIPDDIDTSQAELFMKEMCYQYQYQYQYPDPLGSLPKGLGFQFPDKLVRINIVPRHKSTDRKDML